MEKKVSLTSLLQHPGERLVVLVPVSSRLPLNLKTCKCFKKAYMSYFRWEEKACKTTFFSRGFLEGFPLLFLSTLNPLHLSKASISHFLLLSVQR